MAERKAKKAGVEEGENSLDSGPIKIKWIRLVESTSNSTTTKRCYYSGQEPGATSFVYGYFDVSSEDQKNFVNILVTAWLDDSNVDYTESDHGESIFYQRRDSFLVSGTSPNPSPDFGTGEHKPIEKVAAS